MKKIVLLLSLIFVSGVIAAGPGYLQMAGSGYAPRNKIEQLDSDFTITDTGTGSAQLNIDGVEVMSATSSGVAMTITGGVMAATSLSVPSQLTVDSSSIDAGTFSATSVAVPSQFTATSIGVALGTGTATSMAVPSGFTATTGGVSVIDLTATQNVSGSTYASDSSVSDAELKYINTLSSNAQTQIAARTVNASAAITGGTIAGLTSLAVPSGFTATTAGAWAYKFTVVDNIVVPVVTASTSLAIPSAFTATTGGAAAVDFTATRNVASSTIIATTSVTVPSGFTATTGGAEAIDLTATQNVASSTIIASTSIAVPSQLTVTSSSAQADNLSITTLNIKGDSLYIGSGSGMAFGGLGTYTNTASTAIAAASTWYKYTGFTNILAQNNMVGLTNTDAKITATYAGVYEITGFCDLEAGNNDVIWLGVGIDGCSVVEQSSIADAHMAPTAVSIDITLNGLITLAAGEAVVLCVKNVSAAVAITVEHATMILKQLGG